MLLIVSKLLREKKNRIIEKMINIIKKDSRKKNIFKYFHNNKHKRKMQTII